MQKLYSKILLQRKMYFFLYVAYAKNILSYVGIAKINNINFKNVPNDLMFAQMFFFIKISVLFLFYQKKLDFL